MDLRTVVEEAVRRAKEQPAVDVAVAVNTRRATTRRRVVVVQRRTRTRSRTR